MLKRTICLLLVLLFAMLPLVACNDEEESTSAEASEQSEPDDTFFGYKIPDDVDFNGMTMKVLTSARSETSTCYQIKPECNEDYDPLKLSAVQSAASECTKLVEQELGIEVEEEEVFTSSRYGGPMYQKIRTEVLSTVPDYYICMPNLIEAALLATDGLIYDLSEYLDLNNPWWCKEFNDSVTIAGSTYFVTGDIGTISMESTMFIAFNKSLIEKNGFLDKYGFESMYDMVDANEWTQDKMYEMSRAIYQDTNANGKIDPDDMLGVAGQENIVYWILRSGGEHICPIGSDGYPILQCNTERAFSIIQDAQDYVQDRQGGFAAADDFLDGSSPYRTVQAFIDGHCLFFFGAISTLNEIRGMSDDFGVLPCPRYDKDQEAYSCNVGAWTSDCICIPTSTMGKELELSVVFLEALGAVWRQKGTPVFYEQTLQYQIARDDESMRMLDIISTHRTPELAEIFNWGNMMKTVASMRRTLPGTFVSTYESIADKTRAEMNETVMEFKDRKG